MEFQRTGFRIKLNHSNALPNYIISIYVDDDSEKIDVSGRRIEHTFHSAALCIGRLRNRQIAERKTEYFTDVDTLWKRIFSVTRHNYTTWLVGHDVLPQLIYAGLAWRFTRGEITIDKPRSKRTREDNDEENVHCQALAVIESPPTIVGCRVGSTQGRIVIVDLANWFPGRIPADIMPTRPKAAAPNAAVVSDDGIRSIACDHAESIHSCFAGLIGWVSDNDMGLFRYTAASQAFGAYRHRFMKQQIYCHDNIAVAQLERRAYYGGRSDCFRIGLLDEPIYQLDVNALFPYVMRECHYPYMLARYDLSEEYLGLLPQIDWSASVAEVEIYTDKPLYPMRTDTHVIYPIGTFRTVLCGTELYRAFRDGLIRKVGRWSEYKMGDLFSLWVNELWQMRQRYKESGNPLYEQFTKRIMNSLYGKFAQLSPSWVNVSTDQSMVPFTTESRRDSLTGNWTEYRAIGWQCQRKAERSIKPGSFYAIAAMVTANARVRMDYIRRVCGARNCYYQGVDGIIANSAGRQNLQDNGDTGDNRIGLLRLEHQANYGAIRGISDYQIGSKVVLSSRSLNSEVNDLGKVLQHRYYVMDHLFKNGPTDKIEERVEEWQRKNGYAKGAVHSDGWVEPFCLGTKAMSASEGCSPSDAAADASVKANC